MRNFTVVFGISLIAMAWRASSRPGESQTQDAEAHELILRLTYQSGREPSRSGFGTCGSQYAELRENRAIANSLAGLGASGVPEIEQAFDSLRQSGSSSRYFPNAGWLAYAYASIRGPAAYPQLRTLIESPSLDHWRPGFVLTVAVAFGLTSYVDRFNGLYVPECRRPEPRDALNQLLAGWLKDDRKEFESSPER